MYKAIVFVRTSTETQEMDSQKEQAIKFCKADGYTDEEIKVIGTNGASAIKLDKIYLADIAEVYSTMEENPIEGLYLASLDRFGRDEEIIVKMKKHCINNKIHLKIADMCLSLLFPNKEVNDSVSLMMSILAAQSAIEMRVKKERFHRGRKKNAELGKYNGGYITYGYRIDDNGFYVPNEVEAEVVRDTFELMASDKYSLNTLTEELRKRGVVFNGRLINYQMVLGILKNTAYIGYRDKYVFNHKYPRIISDELYYKVQEVMKNNNCTKGKARKHYHFAALLIKCPECGRRFVASVSKDNYRCSAHVAPKMRKNMGEELCPNDLTISISHLDGLLWSIATRQHYKYIHGLDKEKKAEIEEEIKILEKKKQESPKLLEEIEEEYNRVDEVYSYGRMKQEKYHKRLNEIDEKKKKVTNEIAKYDEEIKKLNALLINNSNNPFRKYFDDFYAITELKAEENAKTMYDIVHKYITDVKLERAILPSNLTYVHETIKNGETTKIEYKLDGRKAVKITVSCLGDILKDKGFIYKRDENVEVIYFIPNIKHITNKMFYISEDNKVIPFSYEKILRGENGFATTESIQLSKAVVNEFSNVLRSDYTNKKELFNYLALELLPKYNADYTGNFDEVGEENYKDLKIAFYRLFQTRNIELIVNTLYAIAKYFEFDLIDTVILGKYNKLK